MAYVEFVSPVEAHRFVRTSACSIIYSIFSCDAVEALPRICVSLSKRTFVKRDFSRTHPFSDERHSRSRVWPFEATGYDY